jgi:hypothetical protein
LIIRINTAIMKKVPEAMKKFIISVSPNNLPAFMRTVPEME